MIMKRELDTAKGNPKMLWNTIKTLLTGKKVETLATELILNG